jgi:cytidine deaminase
VKPKQPPLVTEPNALLARAVEARRGAYAPYSNFAVGAALADTDGTIWTGANVENASYGLSMCAERTALFGAVTSGARAFTAIAVAGPDGVRTLPCGACRQALAEFAPAIRVIFDDGGTIGEISLAELLPEAFGPAQLAEAKTVAAARSRV